MTLGCEQVRAIASRALHLRGQTCHKNQRVGGSESPPPDAKGSVRRNRPCAREWVVQGPRVNAFQGSGGRDGFHAREQSLREIRFPLREGMARANCSRAGWNFPRDVSGVMGSEVIRQLARNERSSRSHARPRASETHARAVSKPKG